MPGGGFSIDLTCQAMRSDGEIWGNCLYNILRQKGYKFPAERHTCLLKN
jgi:hypothetical protein